MGVRVLGDQTVVNGVVHEMELLVVKGELLHLGWGTCLNVCDFLVSVQYLIDIRHELCLVHLLFYVVFINDHIRIPCDK